MRPSRLLLVARATAATAALGLAACSGGLAVPSGQSDTFNAAASPTRTAAKTCRQPALSFVFKGSCDSILLKPTGATRVFLTHYRGIVVFGKFSLPTEVVKNTPFTFVDATGKGDIEPLGSKAFPNYTGSGGTAIVYFKIINPRATLNFSLSPYIGITYAAKLPGSACSISFLASRSTWVPLGLTTTAKTAHVIQFEPVQYPFVMPRGSTYDVVTCK